MQVKQYLPSKEFRGRVVKIIFLLIVILIIRYGLYPIIQNAFNKKTLPKNVSVKTFVDTDTDSDGLPDWEEAIWGTNPEKKDSDGDGIGDLEFVSSKKTGSLYQVDQNETVILSREVLQTLFALIDKGATTQEALGNLGDAAGKSIIRPEIKNKYSTNDFTTIGTSSTDVKNYYNSFKNAYAVFAKSKAPDEFDILSVAISSENPDQLIDLDQSIAKYRNFEKSLLSIKIPNDALNIHVSFTNNIASIADALEKSKLLYKNSIIGINGIIELRLVNSELTNNIQKLASYFKSNGFAQ